MLVLLPPSEGKAAVARRTGGRTLDLGSLSLPALTSTREQVLAALVTTSARPDALARLAAPAGAAEQVAENLRLADAPTTRTARLYNGVLFDALDLPGLTAAAKRRATNRLLVASALWGFSRLTDWLPRYRLGMAARLDGLGTLASVWRPALAEVMPTQAGRGLVVDCRSGGYRAAWPGTANTVDVVVQREVRGRRQVVSHMAKHTRGLLARVCCEEASAPRRAEELADLAAVALPAYEPTATVELAGSRLTVVLRED